jgi:hypothetical protein
VLDLYAAVCALLARASQLAPVLTEMAGTAGVDHSIEWDQDDNDDNTKEETG